MKIITNVMVMNGICLVVFFSYLYYLVEYVDVLSTWHHAIWIILVIINVVLTVIFANQAKTEYDQKVEEKTHEVLKNMKRR